MEDSLQRRVKITPGASEDLLWWSTKADFVSGRSMIETAPSLCLSSDASLTGWGAVCEDVSTGGPWTVKECGSHINVLELLAALRALQCFTAQRHGITVEILVDNTSAVSYINKKGGSRSRDLCSISLEINKWCEERNLNLHAVYLPGSANFRADIESRRPLASGDWRLSSQAFQKIQKIWHLRVDLFASTWNAQLPVFVSWFPQPGASRVDAFSLCWKDLQGYCFPPFKLIPKCLTKLIRDQAEVVMVTPYWPSQAWFPDMMEMSVDVPRLLPHNQAMLTSPRGHNHPLTQDGSIRLIAWRLSGIASKPKAFREMLSNYCWGHPGKIHTLHTSPPGTTGVVGALNGMLIPCLLA